MSLDTAATLAAAQRHTVRTLVAAQAVGAMGITIGIATASLLARDLSGSTQQAGLVQTAQVLGAAVAAFWLARLMSRWGRRRGLVIGLVTGAIGSLLCVLAGVLGSMPLLLFGAVLLGTTTAANSAARFAATDLALPEHRARALSVVVWATTIGAVAGPNLTGLSAWVAQRLQIPELTGPFAIGAVAMLVAALILACWLRPDPLLLARQHAEVTVATPAGTSWGRVAEVIRAEPAVGAAIAGLALAHAVMVAVMVMTPLHMDHGGAHLRVIGVVISIHVLGMFAFSPLVGWLADAIGRAAVLGAGFAILMVSLVLCGFAPEGHSWQILVGLFLLGLGWSFATVAASTLISDLTPLHSRTDVQGSADMVMGLTAAAAGALAGVVVGTLGYAALNGFAGVLALGVAVAAWVAGRSRVSG
ncbi:MFS transporter [Nocardioides limicola]|uniref:MFS transporter n=1 Tax=Nocardioides limicola TaxID=2803368 RepID=UPI00193C4441|nr:MFS transporter [Nocardioides sp. DJM-14]